MRLIHLKDVGINDSPSADVVLQPLPIFPAAAQSMSDSSSVRAMVVQVTPVPMNQLAAIILPTKDHRTQLQNKALEEGTQDKFCEKKTPKQKLLLGILYATVSLAFLRLLVLAIQFIGDFFVLMLVVTRWMPPIQYD
ncbi:hypothetical protein PRNP1_008031 [Phytophthora ramorum]